MGDMDYTDFLGHIDHMDTGIVGSHGSQGSQGGHNRTKQMWSTSGIENLDPAGAWWARWLLGHMGHEGHKVDTTQGNNFSMSEHTHTSKMSFCWAYQPKVKVSYDYSVRLIAKAPVRDKNWIKYFWRNIADTGE